MENTNTISIIKDSKKLSTRIGTVTRSLNTASENVQLLLASSIWRGLAHGDNSGADKLYRNMPVRLQGAVKSYLLEFGPFVFRENAIHTKKGTRPDEKAADAAMANLPDWQTHKKAATEKPYDASKAIVSLLSGLKKKLEEGKIADGDKPAVLAFLSYQSNITAGITREALLADVLIAHDEQKAKESIAA